MPPILFHLRHFWRHLGHFWRDLCRLGRLRRQRERPVEDQLAVAAGEVFTLVILAAVAAILMPPSSHSSSTSYSKHLPEFRSKYIQVDSQFLQVSQAQEWIGRSCPKIVSCSRPMRKSQSRSCRSAAAESSKSRKGWTATCGSSRWILVGQAPIHGKCFFSNGPLESSFQSLSESVGQSG